MNELRQAIAAIIDMASHIIDELDDETMLALSDLLNAAAERLGVGGQNPVDGLPPWGGGGNEPGLNPSMPSSNIDAFGYDEENGRLLVRFLGKHPDRHGPVYAYGGVPPNIYDIFRRGAIPAKTNGRNKWGQWWRGKYPSMGAAMYHLIRAGGYPYQRLN